MGEGYEQILCCQGGETLTGHQAIQESYWESIGSRPDPVTEEFSSPSVSFCLSPEAPFRPTKFYSGYKFTCAHMSTHKATPVGLKRASGFKLNSTVLYQQGCPQVL